MPGVRPRSWLTETRVDGTTRFVPATWARTNVSIGHVRGQTPGMAGRDTSGGKLPSLLRGDAFEMLDGNERSEPARFAGIEAAGAGLEHRGRTGGDGAPHGVLERAACHARGQEAGQKRVPGTNGRNRLECRP